LRNSKAPSNFDAKNWLLLLLLLLRLLVARCWSLVVSQPLWPDGLPLAMAGVGGYMYNVCSVCLEAFKGLSKSKAIGIEILMSSIKAWRGLKDAAGV